MEQKEINNQLESLITRIDKIEKDKGKKDIWDIISIISSFLIPLSIFVAGYLLSEADRLAEIERNKIEIKLAEIKSKVDQAQLVSVFLEALVDTNSYKRQLAIKSILLALPEKGAEIVMEISINDPDTLVKEFAKRSLTDNKIKITRTELVQNIFSPIKETRLTSTDLLTTNWRHDEYLIGELIDFASYRLGNEPQNQSGIINTILVLTRMDIDLLNANRQKVESFIREIELLSSRKQTQEFLVNLKNKIQ